MSKHIYQVQHVCTLPTLNQSATYDRLTDAMNALVVRPVKRFDGASYLLKDGCIIACKFWDEKKVREITS